MSRAKMLSEEDQTQLTRIIVAAAQLLQQHGAESKLIEETSSRLGYAMGLDSTEMSISADAIVMTTLYQGKCITTIRRVRDHGINMHMVCEIQRITLMAEQQCIGLQELAERLRSLTPFKYNRWLVAVMVGFSCASFSRLFGGDWSVFLVTFTASLLAMLVRQQMACYHHNPLINFAFTAFVATVLASGGVHFEIGNRPELAMAASVLLLIPGFPLINAVSDMVKGHVNMGISRWFGASMLTLSAAAGIALAMMVTGVRGWM